MFIYTQISLCLCLTALILMLVCSVIIRKLKRMEITSGCGLEKDSNWKEREMKMSSSRKDTFILEKERRGEKSLMLSDFHYSSGHGFRRLW